MKVRMKTAMAGPGYNAGPGAEIEVPDKMGSDLVRGGYAVAIAETATIEPPENAAMPKPRRRGKL